MQVYQTNLRSGISRSKEFERKKLAACAVNIGTKCGHGCRYCSTSALLRMHPSFAQIGRSSFEEGFAIVDPDTPERVARDAKRIRNRGMVQVCTTVDAWSPEAQTHDLGRRCLEAILSEPGWTVRILTKNAAVARDFDVIERYRDRVLLGLSVTATPQKADVIRAVEPDASPVRDRTAVLHEAHQRGLRTYAMLCPLLPGIADGPEQIGELVRIAAAHGAEELFTEPVNARGPGLRLTEQALEQSGYSAEAAATHRVRRTSEWSKYVVDLIRKVQLSVRQAYDITKLRVLLYPSRLESADAAAIRQDDAGIIWLGKGEA
jgi:DNA repair photolyase